MIKNKKNIIIFISIFILILLIYYIISNNDNEPEKGYWFEVPKNYNQIKDITIAYNGGNDLIYIYNDTNKIEYTGFGGNGNYLEEKNISEIPITFKDYFMNNIVTKIKDNYYCVNKKDHYEIKVDLIPTAGFTYCKEEIEPQWFKELLDVLNANKYGYLTSLKED